MTDRETCPAVEQKPGKVGGAWGYDSDNESRTLREVTLTWAPILRNFNRIVSHWARAYTVPARPSRRRPCRST